MFPVGKVGKTYWIQDLAPRSLVSMECAESAETIRDGQGCSDGMAGTGALTLSALSCRVPKSLRFFSRLSSIKTRCQPLSLTFSKKRRS